jgi:hypothetical protein
LDRADPQTADAERLRGCECSRATVGEYFQLIGDAKDFVFGQALRLLDSAAMRSIHTSSRVEVTL